MSRIIWDEIGERRYETGTSHGVCYPQGDDGEYQSGVAWNGLISVSESPSGGEPTPLWADNIKYLDLMSTEEFGLTIEAYTYPDEFALCDGSAEITNGVMIGQQPRRRFGLSYRTKIGNDLDNDLGYKLHIVYGGLASPSEKGYETINDSPDAITFSWEVTTNPIAIEGFKPSASITIDSTKVDEEQMAEIEKILYGNETDEPRLLLPDELVTIINKAQG